MTLHSRCQTRQAGARAGIHCFHRSRVHLVWWSQTGSNRRPHACKARALPTELWPLSGSIRSLLGGRTFEPRKCRHFRRTCSERQEMVGPGRLELPTLRLSGVRSNHLSYGPLGGRNEPADPGARWARDRARTLDAAMGEVERETKTATSRTQCRCL